LQAIAHEIDPEDILQGVLSGMEFSKYRDVLAESRYAVEGEERQENGRPDEAHTHGHKPPRALLVAEVAQRNGHEGIAGDDDEEIAQEILVLCDVEHCR
jgi:hypothetical protein